MSLKENREKLRRANLSIGVVEVSCPDYALNFPHIATTFGEEYANDLKIVCEQVKAFRAKYHDIYHAEPRDDSVKWKESRGTS